MAQEVKEFSELVKDQYTFLMQQLEKVLKDYFDLSSRVKEMHTEISFKRSRWTGLHKRRSQRSAAGGNKDCTQIMEPVQFTEPIRSI